MLDHYANQASGLLGLGCQPGPKLIAMVSHGDEHAELPLLWQLCLSMVQLGYSITVLDGTTAESDTNPGLEQLLDNTHWSDDGASGIPAWTVMPSAHGLRALCGTPDAHTRGLHHLRKVVPPEGVLALYCQAEWMTTLLGECQTEPLLAVSSTRASLLSSYAALKRLLITGKLRPTIIHMLQDTNRHASSTTADTLSGLRACAERFLGYECKTLTMREPRHDSQHSAEMQSLALRLLENAMTLDAKDAPTGGLHRLAPLRRFDHFAERH
ncbi:hypothetical protein HZ993_11010 [Rhodoferax sp. AJA081-3]|uniref:hypothetical protein n=1 Tax=Rhodoferax sp. AJA081-3 TaxID=2752316 RepID=UPI001ADF8061|nr:hypothetical protein [Rhodoferax sp. AJA081-3]QTN30276.1 hypothetical protein HZ993_11010 [Rhodoferax sp. AJA081-3]